MPTSQWSLPDAPPLEPLHGEVAIATPDPAPVASPRRRSRAASGQKWTRLIHVYTSMIALLVVLFFGATGLTLNHPEWTLGFDPSTSTSTGALPAGSIAGDGTVEFLTISEYLRDELNVRGSVADFGVDGTRAWITYRGPGYAAEIDIDTAAQTYAAQIEQQGLIGVLNDLHKGRSTNSSWGWVIDLSGAFLVVIALTGIGLQLFLARRRRSAVIVAAVGGVLSLILAVITTR